MIANDTNDTNTSIKNIGGHRIRGKRSHTGFSRMSLIELVICIIIFFTSPEILLLLFFSLFWSVVFY